MLDSRSAEWFILSVWFVEQGCSSWYSVMISEEYFYFQGNAYVAWCGGTYIFSKKTNLLLGRWSSLPPLKRKGGLGPSASEPVESRAREAIWKPLCPSKEKQKHTSLRVQEDLDKASCVRKYLFDVNRCQECFWYPSPPKEGVIFFYICAFYFFSLVTQCKVCSHMSLSNILFVSFKALTRICSFILNWVVSFPTPSSEVHEVRNHATFVLGSYSSNMGQSMFKILFVSGLYRILHSVQSVQALNPTTA